MNGERKIRSFSQIAEIDIEDFLKDRELQRKVYNFVITTTQTTKYDGGEIRSNPNSTIMLKNTNAIRWITDNFRIKDNMNLYYFDDGINIGESPLCLMEDDIIPLDEDNQDGCEMFRYPLCRVEEMGSIPERYNTRTNQWELYIDLEYRPPLRQKAKVSAIKFANRIKSIAG